jgi:23S rRNA pseudouridine1911/1915/1917 synthase
MPLEILYEDEHVIAINKKCGMVVHPGSGVRDGTLVNALMHHCASLSNRNSDERPGIVHRLDKDTTGVIIAAKNNAAHDALASAFMNRTIQKEYIGFCIGKATKNHDTINLPLDRSKRDRLKRAPSVHGKPSTTEFYVLDQRCSILAMRFILHTGRTHQIRVHCSAMGFPIIADTLYGGGKECVSRIDPLDRSFAHLVYKCFNRQALHAHSISFKHPVSGEFLSITAPPPEDFQDAMRVFGDNSLFSIIQE